MNPLELRIGSWNIQNLTADDKDRNYERIAKIIARVHVCAIQEILEPAAVVKILPPANFKYVVSPRAVGDALRQEYYAYIYDERILDLVTTELYDDSREDLFRREPFAALFRVKSTDTRFTLLNIHVLYGSGKPERRPEIQRLAQLARELGRRPNLIFIGDFNMEPLDESWENLRALDFEPLFTNPAKTTILDVSLLDNIWVRKNSTDLRIARKGIILFDQSPWYKDRGRATIQREMSDHRLIWADFVALAAPSIKITCVICDGITTYQKCSRCDLDLCGRDCFDSHLGACKKKST